MSEDIFHHNFRSHHATKNPIEYRKLRVLPPTKNYLPYIPILPRLRNLYSGIGFHFLDTFLFTPFSFIPNKAESVNRSAEFQMVICCQSLHYNDKIQLGIANLSSFRILKVPSPPIPGSSTEILERLFPQSIFILWLWFSVL